MAKKNRNRKRKQQNRSQGIVHRPDRQIVDPAIDGEYVDPNVSVSGNVPAANPITTVQQGRRRRAFQAEAISFQGPIPPPDLLREYNEIIPNGAERILAMAEAQSAHRIDLESTVVKGDDRRANWGLITGFAIGIVILVFSFLLIRDGHDVAGTILGSVDLVGLISVFVYGRSMRMKQLEERDKKNRALTRRR